MTEPFRTPGILCIFLLAALPAWAGSKRAGVYEGELGKVELTVDDDRVTGLYLFGGGCPFEAGRRVIDGQLEGDVLVGQLTLCQLGPSCEERVYPFLAIYDETRGSFTTDIALEPGCASPGMKSRVGAPSRLTLSEVPEDKARRYRASVRRNPRKMQRLAKQMIDTAHQRLRNSQFALAAAAYEVGLSYDQTDWAGYMGLGLAQHHLGASQKALEALERSAALKPDYADTWFNLACVHARLQNRTKTLELLKKAVDLGFDVPEQMIADQDVYRLLGEDPGFQQLVQRARKLQAARQR